MDGGYHFLMVSYSLEEMNRRYLDKFMRAATYAAEKDGFTASPPPGKVIGEWSSANSISFRFAHVDEVLKTMIRSNPGLILLSEGTVINKWDDSEVPDLTPQRGEEQLVARGLKVNFWGKLMVILLIFTVPLALIGAVPAPGRARMTR